MTTEHDHRDDCARLSEYLDDELSPEMRAKVEAHIGDCRECRELHEDFVSLLRCCAEYAPAPSVPKDVHDALLGALRKASSETA